MQKNKMITAITSKVVRNHLPLFYSSAALVGSGIAAAFMYQKEDVDENIKKESTPVILLPMANSNVESGSLILSLWNNPIKQYNNCSCESNSLIRYNRQQTINLLRNTSSKVSLKEKYKVSTRCKYLSIPYICRVASMLTFAFLSLVFIIICWKRLIGIIHWEKEDMVVSFFHSSLIMHISTAFFLDIYSSDMICRSIKMHRPGYGGGLCFKKYTQEFYEQG